MHNEKRWDSRRFHGTKRWAVAYNPTDAVLFVVKNGR
jgi:hypothetical protein